CNFPSQPEGQFSCFLVIVLILLGPTATDSQIKNNFRKLSVKYHPDNNKSADAEKAFREIAEGKIKKINKSEIWL
uniref:DnaJ homolog subfamily B member 9 n=1 Tax=Mola mola TaxID=94237 RepID=A0A3Q3XSJ3_MOLML